jgi:hypothetical protein
MLLTSEKLERENLMGAVGRVAGRIRALAVTGLFAGALAIAPAAAQGATQTIPGTGVGPAGHNLTIYIGDQGQLQAKPSAPGDFVQGMFYGDDSGPASEYNHLRLKGAPAPDTTFTTNFVPVSNGPVTGNGTPSSPFQNVTVMKAQNAGTDLFEIRQTVLYTAFEQRFRVVWDVTNVSAMTLPFIWGTSADLYIDSSDSGRGVFIDGASRFVGGTNDQSRTTGGIQEVLSSTLPGESSPVAIPKWASYQESGYGAAISRLNSNDAFLNTIDPNLIDNGVGVSFDNRASAGLPPGQTQRYEVIWHATRPTPLSAYPAAAAGELPGQHQVTLSLVDTLFNPLPNQRVNYEITGVNPSNGQLTAQTGPNGQILVAWNGSVAGLDTLTAYADADNDGIRDPEEPAASATMRWLADNHVDGPPQVPGNLDGPSGKLPVQVQKNPDNPEAPNYIFGRSASAAAGFVDCTFDQRSGRELHLPVSVTLQPGAGTISNVSLALTDPSRHTPTNLASSLPVADSSPAINGNTYSFAVDCVVNGEMWVEFTLTEGANPPQIFRIPVGGLALIDPQGVVYDGRLYDQAVAAGKTADEARVAAAISGATVHLQRLVGGTFVNVLSGDPGIKPNVNPQTTGADGIYQWDVQAGTYRVAVTATGCKDAVSQSVDIPPPALDLHVRLDCGSDEPAKTSTAGPGAQKPSNAFSIRTRKASKSGLKTTLDVTVPGAGQLVAIDAGAKQAAASKKGAKPAALFSQASAVAKGAETVTLTLKLSKAGKARLAKAGKVKASAAVTFTPRSGDPATQKINVTFKKAAKKKKR